LKTKFGQDASRNLPYEHLCKGFHNKKEFPLNEKLAFRGEFLLTLRQHDLLGKIVLAQQFLLI